MPRPWARESDGDADRGGDAAGDRAGRADGGDPPSADDPVEASESPGSSEYPEPSDADDPTAFPTLDPPWPDGALPDRRWPDVGGARREPVSEGVHIVWPDEDGELSDDGGDVDGDVGADDDEGPLLPLGPSWNEPPPCRMPRRQVRPVHRRRSRHSFEPADLSDAELDRLLRGPSAFDPDGGHRRRLPAGALHWPVWAKVAVVVVVALAGLGVVGVLEATAVDAPDTITTREQEPGPNRTGDVSDSPPPWARSGSPAPSPVSPSDLPDPMPPPSESSSGVEAIPGEADAAGSSAGTVAPDPSVGSTSPAAADPSAAPPPVAPAPSTTVAPECHPSYDPCVPLADDVDCAGGQGNGPAYVDGPVNVTGPDDYGLDGDGDAQGCE